MSILNKHKTSHFCHNFINYVYEKNIGIKFMPKVPMTDSGGLPYRISIKDSPHTKNKFERKAITSGFKLYNKIKDLSLIKSMIIALDGKNNWGVSEYHELLKPKGYLSPEFTPRQPT